MEDIIMSQPWFPFRLWQFSGKQTGITFYSPVPQELAASVAQHLGLGTLQPQNLVLRFSNGESRVRIDRSVRPAPTVTSCSRPIRRSATTCRWAARLRLTRSGAPSASADSHRISATPGRDKGAALRDPSLCDSSPACSKASTA